MQYFCLFRAFWRAYFSLETLQFFWWECKNSFVPGSYPYYANDHAMSAFITSKWLVPASTD